MSSICSASFIYLRFGLYRESFAGGKAMGKASFGVLEKTSRRCWLGGGQNELAIGQFDEFVPDEKSENVGPFLISDGEVRDPKT